MEQSYSLVGYFFLSKRTRGCAKKKKYLVALADVAMAASGSRLQKIQTLSVDRLRRIRIYLLPFTRDNHACEH